MQELKIFNNTEFGEVRALEINDEPYFVGKDVATILGYAKPLNALSTHVDEDDSLKQGLTDRLGRKQETILINESGLYSLILSSKLPTAKKFKRWVTSEVLPTIRKHGGYISNQEQMSNEELLSKALLFANNVIAEKDKLNKELQASNSKLLVDNTIMQPKAEYFDELVDRKLLTGIRETAKELKIPPKKFVSFLLSKKYLFRNKKGNLEPYAQHVKNGLFETKEQFNEKTNWSGTQVFITPKGRETFRLLYVEVE